MKYRKHGLGLLLVVALGLLAFAGSAQAVMLGFLINKKPVEPKAGEVLKATAGATQVGTGTLLIPGLNVEINCTGFTVQEGNLNSPTDASGKLLYEGCTALSITPLAELEGCEIVTPEHEEVGGAPHHVTATGLILPAELTDKKSGTEELEPALLIEKIEAKVVTHKELGCILPALTTVKGELCIKIDENDTVEPLLLSSQAIQGLCKPKKVLEELGEGEGEIKDKLLFGAQEAFIDGSARVFLTGAHNGLTLGVSLLP